MIKIYGYNLSILVSRILIISGLLFSMIVSGQSDFVTIEGQIIGYSAKFPVNYSINNYFKYANGETITPDSLGRFVIKKHITELSFFTMNYSKDSSLHSCRLILEPGKHYYFISKGSTIDEWKNHYSPDIFTLNSANNDKDSYYKYDRGQVYYNLIDNGTMGFLYQDQWNLMTPDSLLASLNRKINNQLSTFLDLLQSGEINQEMYDIAKLNIEYTNAYRLATTISSTWLLKRFKINDTYIKDKLLEIYPKIFELYPVNKDVKLENHFCFDRYVELYLTYLADCKTGRFIPQQRKGAAAIEPSLDSRNYLNDKAYKTFSQITSMNYMANYGLNSAEYGRNVLREQPGLDKKTVSIMEDGLLKKVDDFNSLSKQDFPEDIIILDELDPINSFNQFMKKMGNQAILLDLWGTWCPPCRFQFQFQDKLKPFLERYDIKMVYIAFQFGNSRETWKNFVKGYKLKGYHFIATDLFRADLEQYIGKIDNFPTYVIIDKDGHVLEKRAAFPSQTDELISQLKHKLKL